MIADLPAPFLQGAYQYRNASAAITVLGTLNRSSPVNYTNIAVGLQNVRLAGRFQVISGEPAVVVLDVAHNPDAAEALAINLREARHSGSTYAVFGIMKDKDIGAVVGAVQDLVDTWSVGRIENERGASTNQMRQELKAKDVSTKDIIRFPSVSAAYRHAIAAARCHDRIVVFGSFHTVAAVLREIGRPALWLSSGMDEPHQGHSIQTRRETPATF